MTITKKLASFFITMVILMCTCFCFLYTTASAATSGNINKSSTITVNTKANYWYPGSSSITLKQNKTKYTYTTWNGKQKTSSGYCVYNIKATPVSGNGKPKTAKLKGRSVKIKLDKNTTYKISVSYDYTATYFQNKARAIKWLTTPSWWVSSTWKVSSYY